MRPDRRRREPAPALSFTTPGECVRIAINVPENPPFRSFKAAARVRVPLGPPTLIRRSRFLHEPCPDTAGFHERGTLWPPVPPGGRGTGSSPVGATTPPRSWRFRPQLFRRTRSPRATGPGKQRRTETNPAPRRALPVFGTKRLVGFGRSSRVPPATRCMAVANDLFRLDG